MGTGWAVGSASLLGVTLAAAVNVSGVADPVLLSVGLAVWAAAWAYAIATAAYGSRTALLALGAHALAALGVFAPLMWTSGPTRLLAGVLTLVGALTLLGIASEWRRRRGALQGGALVGMLAPLVVGVVLVGGALAFVGRSV